MAVKSITRLGFLAAFAFLGFASTSAYACKGATSLLRDDFTDEDPAWGLTDQMPAKIADGGFRFTLEPDHWYRIAYAGQFFPAADACVEIDFPTTPTKLPAQGGIGIWNGKIWNYVYIQSDGYAGVQGIQNGNWVNPVPRRKADALKIGPGAANVLRVVWKGPPAENSGAAADPTVQVFINDALLVKFKITPNDDRTIALFADTEGGTLVFKNLNITD